jgi:hypothetical protein
LFLFCPHKINVIHILIITNNFSISFVVSFRMLIERHKIRRGK